MRWASRPMPRTGACSISGRRTPPRREVPWWRSAPRLLAGWPVAGRRARAAAVLASTTQRGPGGPAVSPYNRRMLDQPLVPVAQRTNPERSFREEVRALRLGEGEVFRGEGILAVT